MAKRTRLAMPGVARFEVEIRVDDEPGLLYRSVTLTKTLRREYDDAQDEASELEDRSLDLDLPKAERRDLEDEAMRRLCDAMNIILAPLDESSPPAGDLLYEAWDEDKVTKDQILLQVKAINQARTRPT